MKKYNSIEQEFEDKIVTAFTLRKTIGGKYGAAHPGGINKMVMAIMVDSIVRAIQFEIGELIRIHGNEANYPDKEARSIISMADEAIAYYEGDENFYAAFLRGEYEVTPKNMIFIEGGKPIQIDLSEIKEVSIPFVLGSVEQNVKN